MNPLKAPFPWFGGKSRVASLVWERFGDVANYVEPFFGSGAMLLGRPSEPRTETINDYDGFVANFWRAVQADPEAVAYFASWPVNENDLHARNYHLAKMREDFRAKLEGDPAHYDAMIAGWWVWGMSCWIGSGFATWNGPWRVNDDGLFLRSGGDVITRQLPHLGTAGQGVTRQLPHLGDAGRGVVKQGVADWMEALAYRMSRVRVCCGDWERVTGDSVTFKHGITGVFLDPPYETEIRADVYACDGGVWERVWPWALANGGNPMLRISLCGYDGGHSEAFAEAGWSEVEWKARGGYGSQSDTTRGRENATRERIWFSPACIKPSVQLDLFGEAS
jgi:DNA adenine methylase